MAEAERLYAKAANMPRVRPVGVACHIGSQITDLAPHAGRLRQDAGLVQRLRAEGLAVERLDLGGGLGAPYFNQPDPPAPEAYAAMVAEAVRGLDVQLAFEPGRVIAANAGVLLSRVIHVHERGGQKGDRRFLVLDAAMNDLIRPAMYDAFHHIRPVREPDPDAAPMPLRRGRPGLRDRRHLRPRPRPPPLKAGDLVAFLQRRRLWRGRCPANTTPARWSPRSWSRATAGPWCGPGRRMRRCWRASRWRIGCS